MSHSKKPIRTDSLPSLPPRPIGRRLWIYRLLAVVLTPAILFALLELGLRVAGYGTPASYFLPASFGGESLLIENQEFGRRFFPSGLIRRPQPCLMEARKPAGTKRIFVFGESAAMGDPAPPFGMARVMETLLRDRFPNTRFEVINVSMTAINSNVLLPIARECAAHEGDVWVIYMGNNEVVGPFGAGTIFGSKAPPMAFIRAAVAFKATRVAQLLSDSLSGLKPSAPQRWGGMEMFLRQQVSGSDPAMARVYDHFEVNLRDMIQLGRTCGAKIVLSTLAANVKDCAPFASVHRDGLSGSELASWEKDFAEGARWQATNEPEKALECYLRAAKGDSDYADLWYRAGHCYLDLGREVSAREALERALELDALRFRPDRRIDEIIRRNAQPGMLLADARVAILSQSPHGIAGDELLYEHVHPTWEGSYWIGRCLADQAALAIEDLHPANTNWLSMDACAQRLGLTARELSQTIDLMVRRMQEPPFATQSDSQTRLERWRARAARVNTRIASEDPDQVMNSYRQAISVQPDDWRLRQSFARFLENRGDDAQALAEWAEVSKRIPQYPDAACAIGDLLDRQGKHAEAISYFEQALRSSPNCAEAYNGLGLAKESQGKSSEAVACYTKSINLNPKLLEAHVNLGVTYASLGQTNAALAEYASALSIRSNSPSAHANLGKLLIRQGKFSEALSHYRLAVEATPNDPVIRLAFGNACLACGTPEEGLVQYAAALKLRPSFTEARLSLGMELAKRGRKEEALREFEQAVRYASGNSTAQYDLGVAFAQLRRWSEAVEHFREASRLEPANPEYKGSLQSALAKLGQKL